MFNKATFAVATCSLLVGAGSVIGYNRLTADQFVQVSGGEISLTTHKMLNRCSRKITAGERDFNTVSDNRERALCETMARQVDTPNEEDSLYFDKQAKTNRMCLDLVLDGTGSFSSELFGERVADSCNKVAQKLRDALAIK